MSSSIRLVVAGYPHHIRQRGVRKHPVFHDDSDFLVYIRNIRDACEEHNLAMRSYCLMDNHVHLIGVPKTEKSLPRALQNAHTNYSRYFNAKYGFVGHAFQGRPAYNPMDDAYMWNAIRYVERNPVRAGIVSTAEDYLWSSAAAHCGLRDDILLSDDFPPAGIIPDWSGWLSIKDSEDDLRAIRRNLSSGRPWGKPEFIQQLETLTGRSLSAPKRGRPKRSTEWDAPSVFPEKSGND